MGIHRQHLLLPILRCLQCGESEWTIGAELECAACGTKYRLVEDRPVFHDDASISSITTDHLSHRPPPRFLETMASTEGLGLHLGAGSQPETFDNVVEVDYKLYPSVDAAVDAHNLPFNDATFECVVALNVFEHLYDPVKAAGEIHRVLKPGGKVILHTAFLQPLHEAPHHYFNATEHGIRKWFQAFEIEQLTVSWNFHPGVTLSWIVHDILDSAQQHLPGNTVERMRATDLSYWERVWKDRSTDELGLMDEFAKLPQPEQAKVALGFELIAKTSPG